MVPLLLAAGLLAAPAARGVTGAWQQNEQSRVRLITPWATAPASGEVTVGLELETIEGWHVYWKNSGDAGYPPVIDFAATPQVTGAEILWPAPHRYLLPGDLVALGYARHVVYPLRLTVDAAPGTTLALAADLDYLVCEIDCVPYSYRLTVDQPLAAAGAAPVEDADPAAELAAWQARVPKPVEAVAGVDSDGVLDLADPLHPALEVRFTGVVPAAGGEPQLFLEASEVFDAEPPERATDGPIDGRMKGGGPPVLRFRVPLAFRERPTTLPATADFAWTLTGVETAGAETAGGEAAGGDGSSVATTPLEARRTVAARTAPPVPAVPAAQPVALPGAAALLLWAFLGGLLLHLTPTVLPLTVVRLAELGAAPGVARSGALATAGAVVVAALALAFVPLSAGGWGGRLQAPVPVAALALVATLVALNLWGLLGLPVRRVAGADEAAAGTAPGHSAAGFLRATSTGIAVVVLGLAWNLPPLVRSLGPALGPAPAGAGGAGTATALLAGLGLGAGLALPFLLAAASPARFAGLLPAGAAGRARLAEALGFVEAAAVLWLLYLLSRQVTGEGLAFVQLALLGLALVAWMRSATRRPVVRATLVALLLALAAGVLWLSADGRLDAAAAVGENLAAPATVSEVRAASPWRDTDNTNPTNLA